MDDSRQSQIGSNNVQVLRILVCDFTSFIVFTYCENTKDSSISFLHRKQGIGNIFTRTHKTESQLRQWHAVLSLQWVLAYFLRGCWNVVDVPSFLVQCPSLSHYSLSSKEHPSESKAEASQQHCLCSEKHKLSTAKNPSWLSGRTVVKTPDVITFKVPTFNSTANFEDTYQLYFLNVWR